MSNKLIPLGEAKRELAKYGVHLSSSGEYLIYFNEEGERVTLWLMYPFTAVEGTKNGKL
jgi:hypothetical protein